MNCLFVSLSNWRRQRATCSRNKLFSFDDPIYTYFIRVKSLSFTSRRIYCLGDSLQALTRENVSTGWFKEMESISYVYISWTIQGMWMIYITFERGGPKFQIPPLEGSPSAEPCSSVSSEQNGYYAALDFLLILHSSHFALNWRCCMAVH